MDKLNIRDYITTSVLLVIVFLIYTVVGAPIGMTALGFVFIFAVCAVPWGVVFMLFYLKVNKNGCVLLMGILLAAIISLCFWGVSLFILMGALAAELIWRTFDKRRFWVMALCFTVQITFWYLGVSVPLIFFKNTYVAAMPEYEVLFSNAFDLFTGGFFLAGLAATVAGCIAGAFLGRYALNKHFKKAGMVSL